MKLKNGLLPRQKFSFDSLLHRGGVMKSYRKELWFNVPTRRAFINITNNVQQALDECGIEEGLVLVKTK